jgi:uncharacterized repeat protein (TIGR03803 family)
MTGKEILRRVLTIAAIALGLCVMAQGAPQYQVLHAFGKGTDGAGLWSSVTLDKKGGLYGATSGGGVNRQGIVFVLVPQTNGTWRETILHSFPSFLDDGQGPNGGLIQDGSGNWYGTTGGGGADHVGTVFKLMHGPSGWTLNILYSFGEQGRDGYGPTAGLAMDRSGNLYGTAPRPWTTAFELTPGSDGWHETIMHHFGVKKGDGAGPYAGLILDAAGNLYGTTYGGGAYNGGTVYGVAHTATGWHEKVLHSFAVNYADGHTPGWGALVMDAKGSLYGTTAGGGCCGGVVFKLAPRSDGKWKETILYQFQGGAMGFEAGAGVVMDKAGNLYGTTINGGSGCACGVVYKLAPGPKGKWTYTLLHTFSGSDGAQPDANLILDDKGNLYGTTATGGAYGGGVVFEITP